MGLTVDQGTLLDALSAALRRAGAYNRNDQVPPAAVLWTDGERQWEPLVPLLRERLPLLTLGPYRPEERTGPAYWLRCMIARTLPEDVVPADETPIIYLPGVGKPELRAVETCPQELQPLAELQYRGVLWTQVNGKDWTVAAFLQTTSGGLGIELAGDTATRAALQRALLRLADEPVARLRTEAPLRAPFFDALLNPDEIRGLLLWLNDPPNYARRVTPAEWDSFRALCQAKYGFDPEADGPVTAAGLLGARSGPWARVWGRFAEAPRLYPNLPEQLRRARPPQGTFLLFDDGSSWPQDNEEAEARLREAFKELGTVLLAETRIAVAQLEADHALRRRSVWAGLGRTPLAEALGHLAVLGMASARALGGADPQEIAAAYAEWGWGVDMAALDALAAVRDQPDLLAVKAALSALYRPWLEQAVTAFQAAAGATNADRYPVVPPVEAEAGTCILFCDALRLDAAQRLLESLEDARLSCALDWHFAALPTVTPTAKAAVSPAAALLTGADGFNTANAATGARINAESLRRLLGSAGYQTLQGDDLGDPGGRAWTEFGAIDAYGHEHGAGLARHLADELRRLHERIAALIGWGWQRVTVITDHGWLLLPGGLPKIDLPEHLTDLRKGRCARLKPGALTEWQTASWRWDRDVRIALAPGIYCFEAGKEYEHGGLSPQECVTPVLTVRAATGPTVPVTIASVKWTGLRCRVQLAGAAPGMTADIRTRPADPSSSVATTPKVAGQDGQAALVVADDALEGTSAVIVVLDAEGRVVAQQHVLIAT